MNLGRGRGGIEERRKEVGEVVFIGEGASPVREAFGGEDVFNEGETVEGGDGGGESAGGREEREYGFR